MAFEMPDDTIFSYPFHEEIMIVPAADDMASCPNGATVQNGMLTAPQLLENPGLNCNKSHFCVPAIF